MRKGFFIFLSCLFKCNGIAFAQFAPQVNIVGSNAIHYTDTAIKAWATGCTVVRGFKNIAIPDSGLVTSGDSSFATGIADGGTVSLGDSGVATLTFLHPLFDGIGADFVVFENGFANPANPEEAFLELAFVEVSSDGINFFRFPATSLTQIDSQIAGAGTYMNARNINNLAGKYLSRWGVPFDISELPNDPLLDKNAITHIRIIDVVGSIDDYGSVDDSGNKINDPYPTFFPTGGFDLDAVGVMHMVGAQSISGAADETELSVFPNPATDYLHLQTPKNLSIAQWEIRDCTGRKWNENATGNTNLISVRQLPAGYYFITIIFKNGKQCNAGFFKS